MGVTLTHRQLAYGAVAVLLLFLARRCSGPEKVVETVTPENPLVIESPRLRVVSGEDTFVILGPALFAYVGLEAGSEEVPAHLLDGARELQSALREADAALESLGVRVFAVEQPPLVLDASPEAEATAGPPLPSRGVGVLLADPRQRLLRLRQVPHAAALVCAAARTFAKEPPGAYATACR